MKNHFLRRFRPLSWLISGLVLAFAASGLAGCSSDEAPIEAQVNPLGAGAPPVVPASVGGGEEEPGATETNFLTPPCSEDSDCVGAGCGSRKVSDAGAGDAAARDAGAETDAGVGGTDGANDAVPAPKRCKSP